MIRTNVPHIFFIIFLFSYFYSFSALANWEPAKDGDKIILIRHALAPGGGDPEGFKLDNCKTQRNLNEIGINQSKKIGNLFKKNKTSVGLIKIDVDGYEIDVLKSGKKVIKKYKPIIYFEFAPKGNVGSRTLC